MSTQTQDDQFTIWHEPLDEEDWDELVEKPFTDVGQFWTTVDIIKEKGLEYEIEIPEWYEIPADKDVEPDENTEEDEPEAEPDGGTEEDTEVVEPEVVENGQSDAEIVSDVPDQPPERDITDDPIEWLNQTADEFVDTIKGTQAINKKGYRVLQYWYDIDTDSEVVVGPEETDFEYCRVRATAEMPDGQTAVAHGSAHVDRGDDAPILLEMADTRAKSRALSDITGVGAVAVAELKRGEQ